MQMESEVSNIKSPIRERSPFASLGRGKKVKADESNAADIVKKFKTLPKNLKPLEENQTNAQDNSEAAQTKGLRPGKEEAGSDVHEEEPKPAKDDNININKSASPEQEAAQKKDLKSGKEIAGSDLHEEEPKSAKDDIINLKSAFSEKESISDEKRRFVREKRMSFGAEDSFDDFEESLATLKSKVAPKKSFVLGSKTKIRNRNR